MSEDAPEWPWGRLGVTVGVASVALAAFHVPLAGLEPAVWQVQELDSINLSVGALGLGPVVTAFVLVELVTLLRARWRRLRVSGPAARATLTRVTHGLALLLAALQAFTVAVHLEGLNAWGYYVVVEPGWGFRLLTMITLVGGTALMVALATLISRYGVGNGYSVLLGMGVCLHVITNTQAVLEREPVVRVLVLVALLALVVGMVSVLASRAQSPRAAPRAYRGQAAPPGGGGVVVRPLPSGIEPLTTTSQTLLLPVTLGVALGFDAGALLSPGDGLYTTVGTLLVVGLTLLFARLFFGPSRVAALRSRVLGPSAAGRDADAVRRALVPQMLVAAALLVALWWLGSWFAAGAELGLGVVELVVLIAVVRDLEQEMRARRRLGAAQAVWGLQRVYAVDVALELLRRAGIEAEPRTLNHRTLLQFFGPYLPVELLVAERDAARAEAILSQLAEDEPSPAALGGSGAQPSTLE